MPVIQKLDSSGRKLLITINGPFNFSEHNAFRDAYKNVDPKSVSSVSVDLQNTDYIDSSALGMLLLLDEHFADSRIDVIRCSEYSKQVLEIAKFDLKFNIS